jgi:hypothetical protein
LQHIETLLQSVWRKFSTRRPYDLRMRNVKHNIATLLHSMWLNFNTRTHYELQIRNATQNIETLPHSKLQSPNKISTNLKRRQLSILSS